MADPQSRSGERYSSNEVLEWCDSLHASHDTALAAAFDSADGERVPAIMLGPSEAKLLHMLMRLAGVRRAVEIGTLAGYSAIQIARGLPADGRLWTLELLDDHAQLARENLERAGLSDRVEVVVGPALETLPRLHGTSPFDAVFLDADKGSYDVYGRWAHANLRKGGLLVADNAYFFGKLLTEAKDAAAVRRLHEEVARDFTSVCLPTPDGLLIGLKN